MSGVEILADRFLLTVQVLCFVGAFLGLLGIWVPPSSSQTGYTFTYPNGTVATPIAQPIEWSPGMSEVLTGLIAAIFLIAMGAILFCLRRIGAYLRESN